MPLFKAQTLFPQTSILDEWGANFPAFLESFPPTKSLGYLPDFARLEWKKHEAYCAEDSDSLKGSDFNEISPDRNGSLLLTLHPSARLLSSPFPLDQVLNVATGQLDTATLEKRGGCCCSSSDPTNPFIPIGFQSPLLTSFQIFREDFLLEKPLKREMTSHLNFKRFFYFHLK